MFYCIKQHRLEQNYNSNRSEWCVMWCFNYDFRIEKRAVTINLIKIAINHPSINSIETNNNVNDVDDDNNDIKTKC